MQVSVKTIPMNTIPDDMDLIRKRINTCMLELERVRQDLGLLSGMEEQVNQLKKCERKLEVQARYCGLFGNTIHQICRQYRNTENNIMDYSENIRRKARREALNGRTLSDLYPLYHEILFSEGGN